VNPEFESSSRSGYLQKKRTNDVSANNNDENNTKNWRYTYCPVEAHHTVHIWSKCSVNPEFESSSQSGYLQTKKTNDVSANNNDENNTKNKTIYTIKVELYQLTLKSLN